MLETPSVLAANERGLRALLAMFTTRLSAEHTISLPYSSSSSSSSSSNPAGSAIMPPVFGAARLAPLPSPPSAGRLAALLRCASATARATASRFSSACEPRPSRVA